LEFGVEGLDDEKLFLDLALALALAHFARTWGLYKDLVKQGLSKVLAS
jgi:hypothetical protein